MKIESQVVSLELAKKMKELGFKQESLWYWNDIELETNSKEDRNWLSDYNGRLWSSNKEKSKGRKKYVYSDYTVAELGEMLPESFEIVKKSNKWFCCEEGNIDMEPTVDKSEANARAKMLIWLKENKIC